MRPINIFSLTRLYDDEQLSIMEAHMSQRKHRIKIKNWEIEDLRKFTDKLAEVSPKTRNLCFFYSFQMPKLGKEFDLLRIGSESVINIELKSEDVPDAQIRRQLELNRYYLNVLDRSIVSYTYISGSGRLLRLSNNGNLVPGEWEKLAELLLDQTKVYSDAIEDLTGEDKYLISPLTAPGKFLKHKYILTLQQRDIRSKILAEIKKGGFCLQSFAGLPGTGKTGLLYDIALRLSVRKRVCMIYCGPWRKELGELDRRLKRIDFLPGNGPYKDNADPEQCTVLPLALAEDLSAICIDDGHCIREDVLTQVLDFAKTHDIPMVIAYSCEDIISPEECHGDGAGLIEGLADCIRYSLTNRIRVNQELSSFIHRLMHYPGHAAENMYAHVSVSIASDHEELMTLVGYYLSEGFVLIDGPGENENMLPADDKTIIEHRRATGHEYRKVLMLIDETYYYDDKGYLRARPMGDSQDSPVRCLFHGLSSASEEIGIIVLQNPEVSDAVFRILSDRTDEKRGF
ncbi:MAG: ATP-binding protein [Eubacteriales bacterium]|nr:ATP-binding protein [Eubacteriales bacterium]